MAKLLAEYPELVRRTEIERQAYVQKHGYLRRPVGFDMDGRTMVRIGDAIWRQDEEGPYNVVNAIHDHALWFFGVERLELEEGKPFELRHPAIQWMHAYVEMAKHEGCDHQNGNAAAWHRFCYDLFTIRDNAKLLKELEIRLLDGKSFQAARYELKVAAICAAAGFNLYFENESDNSTKHPEFFGVDQLTGARIAVEVKSRHRDGVLGFSGGAAPRLGNELGVRACLLDAYGKDPGAPFYVFIDCNMPPASRDAMQRWEAELYQLMSDLDAEGINSQCPANSVFFTNDPSHYVGTGRIGSEDDMLWVRNFKAPEPKIPHPDADIVVRLLTAHAQRIASPSEFADAD